MDAVQDMRLTQQSDNISGLQHLTHHWHHANGGLAAVASYFCFFVGRLVFIAGKAMTFVVDQVLFLRVNMSLNWR